MPLTTLRPLSDVVLTGINAVAGTPAGSQISIPVPVRGRVIEVGECLHSVVTSTMTLQVNTNDATVSSAASTLTTIVTSTLGTVSSAIMYAGAVLAFIPPSPAYVNPGDNINFVSSGGQSSTVGATFYAVVRKG